MGYNGIDWLPDIVTLLEFSGNWDVYIEEVYRIFLHDMVEKGLVYKKTLVRLTNEGKYYEGKLELFWHIVQGDGINEKKPELRRLERVPWIKPVAGNSDSSNVYIWQERKGHEIREHILLDDKSGANYLIVLSVREYTKYSDYYLITGFPPNKKYLEKLHKRYKKANPG